MGVEETNMLVTVEESDGYVGVHTILSYFCTYFFIRAESQTAGLKDVT